MQQKGFGAIYILVAIVAIIVVGLGSYYLGNKNKSVNEPVSTQTSPTPSINISGKVATNSGVADFDYQAFFRKKFPADLPVYPEAVMSEANNQGACNAELLKKDPECLQVNFLFRIDSKKASLEQIVNWYVTNPVKAWTYRGVYGDQKDYQFGDIYQKDIYYRMEYMFDNPEHSVINIYYNGPYPISDLKPTP